MKGPPPERSDIRIDVTHQAPRGEFRPHPIAKETSAAEAKPRGELRRSRRDSRERGLTPRIRMVFLTWAITLVVLVLVILGLRMLWQRMENPDEPIASSKAEKTMPAVPRPARKTVPSLDRAAAEELVRRAVALDDPAEVAKFFRNGSRKPEEIIAFLRNMRETVGTVGKFSWFGPLPGDVIQNDGGEINFVKGYDHSRRQVYLVPDPQGNWKVDFDSFARQAVPSWDDLFGGKVEKGVIRVFAMKDSYYNGAFTEADWICLGIATPDVDRILFAYCRRGSEAEEDLALIHKSLALEAKDRQPWRVTLEVRAGDAKTTRQFEITRVLARDWVLPDEAYAR